MINTVGGSHCKSKSCRRLTALIKNVFFFIYEDEAEVTKISENERL